MTCPHCSKRSSPQHRRFFGVIKAAFEHWPVQFGEFQPECSEHLRAWLLTKSGHRNVHEIEMSEQVTDKTYLLLESVMRAAGAYGWIREYKGKVYVMSAKSIAHNKLGHKDACRVFEAVEAEICDILGIESCDQLLDEQARAA